MRWFIVILGAFILSQCATTQQNTESQKQESKSAVSNETEAAAFIDGVVVKLAPLEKAANMAWFKASVSGSDEDFALSQAADNARNSFLSDPGIFKELNAIRTAGFVKDPLLARQIENLYRQMLGKQVPPTLLEQVTKLEKRVEQTFNTYRGQIGSKQVTQNEISDILRTSKNSVELEAAWKAQKDVGSKVASDLKELVGLRNQVARALGYRDFFALRLAELELDEGELLALFDELNALTREPFLTRKAEVDKRLAKRLGIKPDKLMPWHYQNPFFQESPDVFNTGLNAIYEKQDPVVVAKQFYASVGIDVSDILERSDLYEKAGKTPHAFAVNVDRAADIRILANVKPNLYWQATMIHELGHAVYDKFLGADKAWLLREAAHPLTTEGIAMLLEHLVGDPTWAFALKISAKEQSQAMLRESEMYNAFSKLAFSRWAQVMVRFEQAMYAEPAQDLNALWWSLVEQYQGLKKPVGRDAPDYASKIHLVIVPVYYQNYMLGELFASQLNEVMAELAKQPPKQAVYVGMPEIGDFLKKAVFEPGSSKSWKELTLSATGKELSAAAFARRY